MTSLSRKPLAPAISDVVDVLVEVERRQHDHRAPSPETGGSPRSRPSPACARPSGRRRAGARDRPRPPRAPSAAVRDDGRCPAASPAARRTPRGRSADRRPRRRGSRRAASPGRAKPPPSAAPVSQLAAHHRHPLAHAHAVPARPGRRPPGPGPWSRTRSEQRVGRRSAARPRPPRPGACRRALVSASWTIRNAVSSTPGGSGAGRPSSTNRTGVPVAARGLEQLAEPVEPRLRRQLAAVLGRAARRARAASRSSRRARSGRSPPGARRPPPASRASSAARCRPGSRSWRRGGRRRRAARARSAPAPRAPPATRAPRSPRRRAGARCRSPSAPIARRQQQEVRRARRSPLDERRAARTTTPSSSVTQPRARSASR